MKRPETLTLIVGYPLVTVPLLLLDGFLGYLFTANDGFGFPAILAALFAWWLLKRSSEAASYRIWRRDWESLDPNYQRPRPIRSFVAVVGKLIVAAFIMAGFIWLVADFDNPASPVRLIAFVVAIAIPTLWGAGMMFRRRQRRATSQEWIVTQAITRSLPAPSVAQAYARLPDYCRPLIASEF